MHNELGGKRITKRNIQGDVTGGRTDTGGGTSGGSTTTVNLVVYCMYVTLTNYDLSGTETVDGESPSNGDRILVANQTDASENGIYIYDSSGDWDRADDLIPALQVSILGGTKQGTIWIVETPSFTVGTDDISIIESAISRKDNSFAGFDAVGSLLSSDMGIFQTSDNSLKSGTIQDILDLVPTGIDDGTTDSQSLRWDSSEGEWVASDILQISEGTSGVGVQIQPASSNSTGVKIIHDGSGAGLYVDTNLGKGNTHLFSVAYDDATVFDVIRSGETTISDQINLLNNHGVIFYEDNSNGYNYVKLIGASNIASNVTFTLPSADGTADQVMKTDGSGNLGWADAGGGFYDGSVHLTSDESVTGNTLTDSSLTIALDSTSTYMVRAVLYLDTNGSAQQPKGNFTYSGTIDYSGLKNYNGTYKSSITDSSALFTTTTSKGYLNELTGMITTTTSGDLTLQFANTYGAGTVYLRKGSILYYKKVL